MTKFWILLLLSASFAVASPCKDPRLRSATVRGSMIQGLVSQDRNPVKFVPVLLYSADKLARSRYTDKTGIFDISYVSPGKYELFVLGWEKVPLEVVPQPKRGQVFSDFLNLDRHGHEICVDITSSTN